LLDLLDQLTGDDGELLVAENWDSAFDLGQRVVKGQFVVA
jgi:hypothetical protein